jgi:hypothetical protein
LAGQARAVPGALPEVGRREVKRVIVAKCSNKEETTTTTSLWITSQSPLPARKSTPSNVIGQIHSWRPSAALLISLSELFELPNFSKMASAAVEDQLGQVLIDFSTNGAFPEEESVSAAYVQQPCLAPALAALSTARSELEASPPTADTPGLMKLTRTFRQRSAKSAVTPLPMLTPGSSMRNPFKMISIDQGSWRAPLSGRQS